MSKALLRFINKLHLMNPEAGALADKSMRNNIARAFHTDHGIDEAAKLWEPLSFKNVSDQTIDELTKNVGQKHVDTMNFGKWSELGQPSQVEMLKTQQGFHEKINDLLGRQMSSTGSPFVDSNEINETVRKMKDLVSQKEKYGKITGDYKRAQFERGLPRSDNDIPDSDIESVIPGFTKWMKKKKLGQ